MFDWLGVWLDMGLCWLLRHRKGHGRHHGHGRYQGTGAIMGTIIVIN